MEGASAQAPGQEQLGGLRAHKEAGLERSERGLREVTLGWAGATNIGLGVPGKVAGEWIESQVK